MGDEVQASDTPKEVGGKLEELQKFLESGETVGCVK